MVTVKSNKSIHLSVMSPVRADAVDGAVRRGISLLEVLISMFVLLLGLLGVASLVPAGKVQILIASQADRSSAVGRVAVQDVKVDGMVDADQWLNYAGHHFNGDPNAPVVWYRHNAWVDPDLRFLFGQNEVSLRNPTDAMNSIVIDPLFLARHDTDLSNANDMSLRLRDFPITYDNDPQQVGEIDPNLAGSIELGVPRMTRVRLPAREFTVDPAGPPIQPMGLGLADRMFTWQDDLMFTLPDGGDLRPQQLFTTDLADFADGTTEVLGPRSFQGDYSWMMTVSPIVGDNSADAAGRKQFSASVAVFYKRDMTVANIEINQRRRTPPAERAVYADFRFGPLQFGGGDVLLRLPMSGQDLTGVNTGDPEESDMPVIEEGHWLMLSAWVRDRENVEVNNYNVADGMPLYTAPVRAGYRAIFRWYQVVASDGKPKYDAANQEWTRRVTLSGPDFDPSFYVDVDDPGPGNTDFYPTTHAILPAGVIAVFEKTIALD